MFGIRFSQFRSNAEPSRQAPASRGQAKAPAVIPTVDEDTARFAAQMVENSAFERVIERLRAERFVSFASAKPGFEGAIQRDAAHVGLLALDRIVSDIQGIADELKLHQNANGVTTPLTRN
jgi:hypothetical protein